MSLRGPAGAAIGFVVLLAGCNKDYPNPFPTGGTSKAPPTGAALVFTSSAWSTSANSGRELFSLAADGTNPTRLTFCNTADQACDTEAAAIAPEGRRAAVTRLKAGVSGEALVYLDLARGVEADIASASTVVSGIDWAPATTQDILAYSAVGQGGLEDLFRADPNGQNTSNLTQTAAVHERKPRIDPGTSIVAYERTEAGGKSEVFIFVTGSQQARVTPAGPGGAPLTGTPYLVGSDADPCFSPDTSSLVFRRLTSVGSNGLGTWDIVTAKNDGTSFTTLATGSVYRGAPDWGTAGIVYPEIDTAAGTASLVLIQPDGSGRKVLYSQGSRFALSNPRWLRQVAP
jgi:Tol biopolymer transport system component